MKNRIYILLAVLSLLFPMFASAQTDAADSTGDGEATETTPDTASTPAPAPAPGLSATAAVNPHTDAGSFEIGIDQILVLSFSSNDSASSTDFVWIGGLQPRVFIMDNWSISASLNFAAREANITTTINGEEMTSESSDSTFLGFLMTHYYVPMGEMIFFKPGIGFGGLYGARERPGAPGTTLDSTLVGFAMRVDVGFAFHFNDHVNLKVGFDLLPQFGTETPDSGDGEGEGFTQVDAGLNASLGIVF